MRPRVYAAALLLALLRPAHGAPTVPFIDPQAKTLLTQMVAASVALKAYNGTITVSQGRAPHLALQSVITVKVRRPNLFSVTMTAGGSVRSQVVSDGKTCFLTDYKQGKYFAQPVPDKRPLDRTWDVGASFLVYRLTYPSPPTRMLHNPSLSSIELGPVGVVNGLPVRTLVIKSQPQPGMNDTVIYGVDPNSHLPRSFTHIHTVAPKGRPKQTESFTEVFTGFQANPPFTMADFTFEPGTTLQKVASQQDMQTPMYDPRLTVGADPFPIAATDISGQSVSLDSYKGKVVMLDFWATWCGPCVGEMPNVIAAYDKYHAQGFDIIGVALDQPNNGAAVSRFSARSQMPWPEIYDGNYFQSKMAVQYGVQAIPFSLLIGRDGKIAAVGARGPDLAPAIEAALAKP